LTQLASKGRISPNSQNQRLPNRHKSEWAVSTCTNYIAWTAKPRRASPFFQPPFRLPASKKL
jgi:hypothetical protein